MNNLSFSALGSAIVWGHVLLGGCAYSREASQIDECDVHSLAIVAENPMPFQNKIFCGEAFVRIYRGTMRITPTSDEEPSYDITFLVPADGRRWLENINDVPQLFFIRARIDPQAECFRQRTDAPDEEGCLPFRRPVDLHITSARRGSLAR